MGLIGPWRLCLAIQNMFCSFLTSPISILQITSDPEQAAHISKISGHPVKYIEVPLEQLAIGLQSAGVPTLIVNDIISMNKHMKGEQMAMEVFPDLTDLLGHPGTTFEQYCRDHVGLF